MLKAVTGLNEKGKKQFEAFVDENAKPEVSRDYYTWWDDFNFESDDSFHFELAGRYSMSGNPITLSLGADCLLIEEIEE